MFAFLQVLVSGVVTGCLYGLLALGIVLMYRTTGILNFAYGAIGTFGACFMYGLLTSAHMNFWLAGGLALLFSAGLGMVVERCCARPVLNAPIFTKVIATLALALILETIAQQIWPQLSSSVRFSTPFEGHSLRVGGLYLSLMDGVVVGVTILIVLVLNLFLTYTRSGIAMRAMSDGLSAARLVGIPVGRLFLAIWAISAVIATVTSVLLAGQQQLIDIQFMNPILLLALIGAVLGGLDHLPGALLGGILVSVIDNMLAFLLAGHSIGALNLGDPGIREALIFGGFVLILLLRPQGLFGQALLRRV